MLWFSAISLGNWGLAIALIKDNLLTRPLPTSLQLFAGIPSSPIQWSIGLVFVGYLTYLPEGTLHYIVTRAALSLSRLFVWNVLLSSSSFFYLLLKKKKEVVAGYHHPPPAYG